MLVSAPDLAYPQPRRNPLRDARRMSVDCARPAGNLSLVGVENEIREGGTMGDNVFVNGRAAVHKGSCGKSTAFPDVCLCPPGPPAGPVPTPLTNTAVAADLAGGAASVLVEGNPVGTIKSYISKSTGNEVARSTGGGVVSGATQGKARFGSHSMNVFFEGEPAVQHMDLLTHNHAGGPGNTPPSVWTSVMAPREPTGRPPLRRTKTVQEGKAWLEVAFVDETGGPAEETRYRLTTPGGRVVEGELPAGGTLRLERLAAGRCQLELPDVDARAGAGAGGRGALASGLTPYRPGRAARLATDEAHRVALPGGRTFWIDLPIRVRDTSTWNDRFVLRSDDGKYEVAQTVRDDRVRGDEGLTLAFRGVEPGRTYTLLHDPGEGGAIRTIFEGRSYEDLFPKDPPEDEDEDEEEEDDDGGASPEPVPVARRTRAAMDAREDEDEDDGEIEEFPVPPDGV